MMQRRGSEMEEGSLMLLEVKVAGAEALCILIMPLQKLHSLLNALNGFLRVGFATRKLQLNDHVPRISGSLNVPHKAPEIDFAGAK